VTTPIIIQVLFLLLDQFAAPDRWFSTRFLSILVKK